MLRKNNSCFNTSWIKSARFDTALILAPPFIITALVASLPNIFQTNSGESPVWTWVVFILCIDVAHVYSTLFRTYFARGKTRTQIGLKLILTPLFCWLGGIALFATGAEIFWRTLAYLAVFHFIRQAYGFMRIYSREENLNCWERRFFAMAIYAATLYPLLFWHLNLPRAFNWFIENDFFDVGRFLSQFLGQNFLHFLIQVSFAIYIFILSAYLIFEIRRWWVGSGVNIPRLAVVLGNALSWYVGIVIFNADLPFTATNVVAHGIPYLGLTFAYWQSEMVSSKKGLSVSIFFSTILAFAYIEEGLWDGLVWHDHVYLFSWAARLPKITSPALLTWLIPTLALPQITHYVLDGFVWKLRSGDTQWKSSLMTPILNLTKPSDDNSSSILEVAGRKA